LPPHQTDAEHTPWTVSAAAVCARWRTIVVSQSSSWTSIRYVDTSCDEPNGPKYETQLLRSARPFAHVQLTIEIGYNQDEDPSLKMFYDPPLLRTVYVNRGLWSFPVTMLLPWSQLSGYGGSNTWDGHPQALRSASNLVDCSLEIL
jgi:hypothetical protein